MAPGWMGGDEGGSGGEGGGGRVGGDGGTAGGDKGVLHQADAHDAEPSYEFQTLAGTLATKLVWVKNLLQSLIEVA